MNRRKTNTVTIGNLTLGSRFPVRIQSMTTTDTMDTEGSVAQSIRMIEAGCELVRLTAPSIKEAKNLAPIKEAIRAKGYSTPLVADIHFTPNAAEAAAAIVEKVRVNPGNYIDKKKFETLEYTDEEYLEEIERIREKFTPLVLLCKQHHTAIRIGTNHGSLSDRIMSRYGDTPHGMVESALEFIRICRENDFHDIVVSMKSSNPQVMIQAYRLLVQKMEHENMHYPLHLGVTEAGDGEDGRIKSAIGIGTLLEEGIGDTIRVSLTEDPEFEVPVARLLASRYAHMQEGPFSLLQHETFHPFQYARRHTYETGIIGGHQVPRVISDLSRLNTLTEFDLKQIGYTYDAITDKWHSSDMACDFVYLGNHPSPFMLPNGLQAVYAYNTWKEAGDKNALPFLTVAEAESGIPPASAVFLLFSLGKDDETQLFGLLRNHTNIVLVLQAETELPMMEMKTFFFRLDAAGIHTPVIISCQYNAPEDAFTLFSSIDAGGLFIDGYGDGIMLFNPQVSQAKINSVAFGILQATRTRISKTEYISCPSCGRTLFDLQQTTAMIRSRTDHLKGIKIAIMGCIVNGPGEMADADYGYVGSGVDKITLYRGKEIVKRGINKATAVDELISLIRDDGLWVEKG